MKFSAVTAALLLAGSAVAAPGTHAHHHETPTSHTKSTHSNSPSVPVRREEADKHKGGNTFPQVTSSDGIPTNDTHNRILENTTSGASFISTGFTGITGTFNVPFPTTAGHGSAVVNLDGRTCLGASLSVGVRWERSQAGAVSYYAMYQWLPDNALKSSLAIKSGDVITATIVSHDPRSATATLENKRTHQTLSHTFTGASRPLCYVNAGWLVDNYQEGDQDVALANFGTVTFTGASVTKNGAKLGVQGADTLIIQNFDVDVTAASLTADGVKISYL